jgi:hypothetical protein
MSDEKKKCGHAPCKCLVEKHESYCSEMCKDSRDVTELSCDCPHEGCGGKI